MSFAAVVPAMNVVGALATLASSVVSAMSGSSSASEPMSASEPGSSGNATRMQDVLKRQESMQLKAMQMQTEANIQKMMADTLNGIASGHLDSGNKVQNASHKAAQGIQF